MNRSEPNRDAQNRTDRTTHARIQGPKPWLLQRDGRVHGEERGGNEDNAHIADHEPAQGKLVLSAGVGQTEGYEPEAFGEGKDPIPEPHPGLLAAEHEDAEQEDHAPHAQDEQRVKAEQVISRIEYLNKDRSFLRVDRSVEHGIKPR